MRSNLLVESLFAYLGADPTRVLSLIFNASAGKAALKARIASETAIDAAHLPYDPVMLAKLREARQEGRKVFVVSSNDERYAAAVAGHVGADGWFGSSASQDLSGESKRRRLAETFGPGGFDYVAGSTPPAAGGEADRGSVAAWIRLARPHQWAKNLLVFVPVLSARAFDAVSLIEAAAAFVAFSLAASSVYIFNDLVDLDADRKHPAKRRRPLAAGAVPIVWAPAVAALLMAAALAVAVSVNLNFASTLIGYICLTTAYSFFLKRKMLIDVVTLAALYTVRVFGGAAAISVPVSEWLLGFSMFVFMSLALIKRYCEMTMRIDEGLPDPTNRNYQKGDLDIIAALAAAAGFNAVTVFALYASSDFVTHQYRHPKLLWLICPILMYWLSRALMMAHRRFMDVDPILFAMKDRKSLLAFALIAVIMLAAA